MKKIMSLLAITVLFAACSVDDDSNEEVVTSIEGNYKLTAFTTTNAYDLNEDGTASTDVLAETGCLDNNRFVFATNNRGEVVNANSLDVTLTPVEGSTDEYEYTITCVDEPEFSAFVYNVEDDMVRVTSNGESFDGIISEDTITFTIEDGFNLEEEGPNGPVEISEDITLVYTKQ